MNYVKLWNALLSEKLYIWRGDTGSFIVVLSLSYVYRYACACVCGSVLSLLTILFEVRIILVFNKL